MTSLLFGACLTRVIAQEAAPAPGTPSATANRPFELDGRYIAMSPDGAWVATLNQDTDDLCAIPTASLGIASDDSGDNESAVAPTCVSLEANRVHSISFDTATWSPDSTQLAFSENGAVYYVDADIWVFTVATGELTNLTDDGVFAGIPLGSTESDIERFDMDLLPAWSPDGNTIAFARSPWNGEWQGTQIAAVPADGSAPAEVLAPINLTTPFAVYFGMAFAPNGDDLYFTLAYTDPDNPKNGVWRLSLKSGAADQLAGRFDAEEGYPTVASVSPLGDRVLTYDALYAGQFGLTGSAYAYLDPTTSVIEPILAGPQDEPNAAVPIRAIFSPDGQWLAFIATGTRIQSAIIVRPADLPRPDQDTTLLDGSELGVTFTALSWADNGLIIAMINPEHGYLLNVSGGS